MINHNNHIFFNQLVETFKNFKIVCSSLSIDAEIIVGVSGIALIIGMVSILYMNIESLLNPLAEISEEEKNRRRRYRLSDKLNAQIRENERRRKIHQSPVTYDGFGALLMFGHLVHVEQILLVEIMRQKPSSHLRFTFLPFQFSYAHCFYIKNTTQRPCAD